jgi:carboxyl-terminal processing protease
VKQIESTSKLSHELNVEPIAADVQKLEYDSGKSDRFKQWIKNLKGDIYLNEAVNVIDDMVVQNNLVYNNKKQ